MNTHVARKLVAIWTLVLVTGLATGIAPQMTLAAPAAQSGPTTWTVLVGGQAEISAQEMGPAGAWQFMRFYPETITINVGDTVVWKLNSAEPHTVTFPVPGQKAPDLIVPEGGTSQRLLMNPLAVMPQGAAAYDGSALTGSGQLGGGPSNPTEYTLTFTTEGTFDYFCTFHAMMKGKVITQAAGSAYPKTQAQIDTDAAAQLKADTDAAMKAEPAASQGSSRPGPDGTTIYAVNVGYGDGTMSFMRFGPTDLTIHLGDTVEWSQKDVDAPHTVTLTSGDAVPELVLVEPQEAGPPKLVVNPAVAAPAGGTTYSGTGFFNSGLLQGTQNPAPGPRTYSLVFDTAGTYEYVCVLHDEMGMAGHITVTAAGEPSALPVTGGTGSGFGPWWLALVGLGFVVVGLPVAWALRRKRSAVN